MAFLLSDKISNGQSSESLNSLNDGTLRVIGTPLRKVNFIASLINYRLHHTFRIDLFIVL